WQYTHRNGQPAKKRVSRVPGPSTTVTSSQEWREATWPSLTAVSRSDLSSSTSAMPSIPAPVRRVRAGVASRSALCPMPSCALVEGAVQHVQLLLTGELDEIDRIAGDPHGEVRIVLRPPHRIDQGVLVEHVDVRVEQT